jgi:hypothetical protein
MLALMKDFGKVSFLNWHCDRIIGKVKEVGASILTHQQ